MKKLIYAIACTLAVASCNQDAAKKAEQIAQQQRRWNRLSHRKIMRLTT